MGWSRIAVWLILSATAFLVVEQRLRSVDPGQGDGRLRSGDEMLVVLLVSAHCVAARSEEFELAVREMLVQLNARAQEVDYLYATQAVALDWSVKDGLKFLRDLGEFDEVSAGRNWLNSGSVTYLLRDLPGEPTIPQVLVLRRRIAVDRYVAVGPDELLMRKIGAAEIIRWVHDGTPLPLTVLSKTTPAVSRR